MKISQEELNEKIKLHGMWLRDEDGGIRFVMRCADLRVAEDMADSNCAQREGMQCTIRGNKKHANAWRTRWWGAEPDMGRVADGVAARVDRLKAIGNGQVPAVAATAFRILSGQY